jgi:thiol-disulfide isomerase/thioredoxin
LIIGRHKGKGNSKYLLNECFKDAKDKDGIVVITSNKPFTTKKNIFLKYGFEICDKAEPYFELLVKKFNSNAPTPKFNDSVKKLEIEDRNGLVILYAHQCPYYELHIGKMLQICMEYNIQAKKILIDNKELAKNFPSAFGTCSIFYNGKFITHELWRENKLRDFLSLKYNSQ